jgi:hypothetical protein
MLVDTRQYTTALGYGNTTRFRNYRCFEELEVMSLGKRLDMITQILVRLDDPKERSRASEAELLAYKLRTRFLIMALIPRTKATEDIATFMHATKGIMDDVMGCTSQNDSEIHIIAGYSLALAQLYEGHNGKDGYVATFDNTEEVFGLYRHAKWVEPSWKKLTPNPALTFDFVLQHAKE